MPFEADCLNTTTGGKRVSESSLHGGVLVAGRIVWTSELTYLHVEVEEATEQWGQIFKTSHEDDGRATISKAPAAVRQSNHALGANVDALTEDKPITAKELNDLRDAFSSWVAERKAAISADVVDLDVEEAPDDGDEAPPADAGAGANPDVENAPEGSSAGIGIDTDAAQEGAGAGALRDGDAAGGGASPDVEDPGEGTGAGVGTDADDTHEGVGAGAVRDVDAAGGGAVAETGDTQEVAGADGNSDGDGASAGDGEDVEDAPERTGADARSPAASCSGEGERTSVGGKGDGRAVHPSPHANGVGGGGARPPPAGA